MKIAHSLVILSVAISGLSADAGTLSAARQRLREIFHAPKESPSEIEAGQRQITEAIQRRAAQRPKACGEPRFAEACQSTTAIAQLDDGSLAILQNPENIQVLRPKGSTAADISLEIPQRNFVNYFTDRQVTVRRTPDGEILAKDGSLANGEGGATYWKPDGSLRHAQYDVQSGTAHLYYTVSRNSSANDSYYVMSVESMGRWGNEKRFEMSGLVHLESGEKLTSVRNLNPEEKTLTLIGIKDGKRFERVAKVTESTNKSRDISTQLPPADAVQ